MKKILSIAALLGTIFLAGSCKKDITLEPLDAITPENYFHNAKDISASLAGIYASFQVEMIGAGSTTKTGAYNDPTFGGFYQYWGEGRSDNFDRSGYPNSIITELSLNSLTYTDGATDWGGLYRTISRANLAIKYYPQVLQYDNTVTQTTVNNALAQAYAMRAESYFYIVRLWGDAPIWTDPVLDITQAVSKPRVAQTVVLDSIVSDLKKAYTLIQKQQTPVVWNIGEGTICAMLADVYMWRHDYANAKTWMETLFTTKGPTGKVYAADGKQLEPTATWKNVFLTPTASAEPIWSIHWDYTVNGCACIPSAVQNNNNPIKIDSLLQANWKKNKNDIRMIQTIDTLTATGHVDKMYKYYNFQATVPSGFNEDYTNIYLPMYRLGDMYLLYAEAVNQLNDLPTALKFLNFIHQRAGLPQYTAAQFTTKEAMQDAILQERQWELYGEGKRWFDLVRTDHVQVVMDPVLKRRQRDAGSPETGFPDKSKVLWPVSQAAMHANNQLVQNPGY